MVFFCVFFCNLTLWKKAIFSIILASVLRAILSAKNTVFMANDSTLTAEKSGAIAENYDASKLSQLKGLEAVRKKPGMYIGGTDERALHHCVSEVLDNSVDEHLAGHCDRIDVAIHVDGSISIRDNGRGIPVDIHPQYNIPGVEMVLTTLHSG